MTFVKAAERLIIRAIQGEEDPTTQWLCGALQHVLTRDEVVRLVSDLSERGIVDCYPADSEGGPAIRLQARAVNKPEPPP